MKKGKYVRGTSLSDSSTLPEITAQKETPVIQQDGGFIKRYLPIIAILIITAFVYSFSIGNQATNWDDDKYTDNSLIKTFDLESIKKIFNSDNPDELYFMGNYHPLTMLTLNVDYQHSPKLENGKPSPTRFIVVNILLHLMCCLFVYLVFSQLFNKKLYPIMIALLFGIHTLHVESVTWISERKDVLYTMFYFMSLYCYILYRKRQNVMFYISSVIIFILSALSKGQAVSLTITLFLVDYLILEDYLNWKKHLNKIPFFIISLIFGLISVKAQSASTALAETDQYELYQRIAFGSNGFLQYILRFILPVKLANLYPYPDIINRTVPVIYWLTVPVFVILILLNLFTYKKDKTFTFGLMFYIVNIALLLQFIPVGSAMYADRYSYIPSVGLSVLMVYLFDLLITKFQEKRNVFYIIFSIYSILLCILTINREKVWQNSQTLWSDCVSKYPEAVIGWNNLGSFYNMMADSLYQKSNDSKYIEFKKSAIDCFTNGIKYKPDYVHSFYNRGMSSKDLFDKLQDSSYLTSAFNDFNSAILFDKSFAPAFQNRALIYDTYAEQFMSINKDSASFYTSRALFDYDMALTLDTSLVEVYMNRGTTYGKSGQFTRSIDEFNTYIKYRPKTPSVYSNRGLAYNGLKRYDDALSDFNHSLELDSTLESTYFNRAITYRLLGDSLSDKKYYGLAAGDISKCIDIQPNKPSYYYYRALYLRLAGNRGDACEDFHKALNLNYEPARVFVENYCNSK